MTKTWEELLNTDWAKMQEYIEQSDKDEAEFESKLAKKGIVFVYNNNKKTWHICFTNLK